MPGVPGFFAYFGSDTLPQTRSRQKFLEGRAPNLASSEVWCPAFHRVRGVWCPFGARVDKWKTETFVGVNRALGMATPDEVVVLYYDSKKHAERFRKNSSDIIDLVNDFNDAHVEDFVYYEAKVMR